MTDHNYSKHKDRSPEDTIFTIRSILNNTGLFPVVEWFDGDVDRAISNRVTLYPTSIGTNGKGTDKIYAEASATAELMERMQNGMLFRSPEDAFADVIKKAGFVNFPDEKFMPIPEILAQNSIFFAEFFKSLGITNSDFQEMIVKNYFARDLSISKDDKVRVVPFADIDNNRIVWLPHKLVRFLYGSNGMAAGNTMEEAMVQALAEVFERYSHLKIIIGEATPPEIPREYLKNFPIYSLIEEFERGGRFAVTVLDGSLGKGLPVALSVVTDKENGTFAVSFGSHPSFSIAVERTLTEVGQGCKTREILTKKCRIGSEKFSGYIHNIINTMKTGAGYYHYDFMLKKPDWEFTPWGCTDDVSNKEMLKQMFSLMRRENFHALVRDVSFLGFPACYILVPGMSEMYLSESLDANIKLSNTNAQIRDDMKNFPCISEQTQVRLLRIIQMLNQSQSDNSAIFGHLIDSPKMSLERIGAFLALQLGQYNTSRFFFNNIFGYQLDDNEKRYLRAMINYVKYLEDGLSNEDAHKILSELFADDLVNRIVSETQDLSKVMEVNFPHMKCFDCDKCEFNGKECTSKIESGFYEKILAAMSKSNISQQDLLNFLKQIMN